MRTGKRGRPTLLYSVTTLDPNQILSTYLDVITATAISLAEGSDGVAQAIAVGKNWAGLTQPRSEAGSEGANAVAPSAVSSAEAASAAAATSDAVAAEPSHLSETGANTAAEANMTQRLENAIAQLRPIFTVMGFAPELAKNKLVLH